METTDKVADAVVTEGFESLIPDDTLLERGDYVDSFMIEEMEKQAEAAAEEGDLSDSLIEAWDDLDPKQREAILSSDALGTIGRSIPRSPRHIDWTVVPRKWHVRWIAASHLRAGFGMRGYRPVLRDKETQKWVPNCTVYGSGKFFVIGGDTLCAIPKRVWLLRQSAEWQSANVGKLQEYGEEFRGAIKVLRRKAGLTKAQAARLEREGFDGLTLTRVSDPAGRDMVQADEEAAPVARRRRGRTEGQ